MKQFFLWFAVLAVSMPQPSLWASSEDNDPNNTPGAYGSPCTGAIIQGGDSDDYIQVLHSDDNLCKKFEQKKPLKKGWRGRLRYQLDQDGDGVLDFFDAAPNDICRYRDCLELEENDQINCYTEELMCQQQKIACKIMRLHQDDRRAQSKSPDQYQDARKAQSQSLEQFYDDVQ